MYSRGYIIHLHTCGTSAEPFFSVPFSVRLPWCLIMCWQVVVMFSQPWDVPYGGSVFAYIHIYIPGIVCRDQCSVSLRPRWYPFSFEWSSSRNFWSLCWPRFTNLELAGFRVVWAGGVCLNALLVCVSVWVYRVFVKSSGSSRWRVNIWACVFFDRHRCRVSVQRDRQVDTFVTR